MRPVKKLHFLPYLVFIYLACGHDVIMTPTGTGPNALRANFASIQTNILRTSCAVGGCHVQGGGAPMSLEAGLAYNNLVGVTSTGYSPRLRVVAGDPDNSVMYQKIIGAGGVGGKMPPGESLTQAQMDTIRAWILKGAKNDSLPPVNSASTLSQIQVQILNQNCTGCHIGPAPRPNNAPFSLENVDSTFANLVNTRTLRNNKSDSLRVVPFRSDLSYLIRLLQGNGEPPTPQMPPLATQNKLNNGQIQQIQSWIDSGAPKN